MFRLILRCDTVASFEPRQEVVRASAPILHPSRHAQYITLTCCVGDVLSALYGIHASRLINQIQHWWGLATLLWGGSKLWKLDRAGDAHLVSQLLDNGSNTDWPLLPKEKEERRKQKGWMMVRSSQYI